MTVEETKHDLWLKRIQVLVAILAGVATLIFGIFNFMSSKKKAEEEASKPVNFAAPKEEPSPLRSAIEETGASWIKSLSKKDASKATSDSSN